MGAADISLYAYDGFHCHLDENEILHLDQDSLTLALFKPEEYFSLLLWYIRHVVSMLF